MLRPIKYLPDPVLRRVAKPVGRITAEIRSLIDDMFETMDAAKGIGLAAPQVGVSVRLFVTGIPPEDDEDELPLRKVIINPEIVRFFPETEFFEEGCLSIPKVTYDVERPVGVEIRGLDERGRKVRYVADGLFGRCIQHEIDHLDGILFIDRVGMSENEAIRLMKLASEEK